MDYYAIGQRVRKYRKAGGLSQEELAERVGISVTHMSHIETGNTKLSLQVFADLAQALGVGADALLYDAPWDKTRVSAELTELFDRCSVAQLSVLLEILRTAKTAMDRYL